LLLIGGEAAMKGGMRIFLSGIISKGGEIGNVWIGVFGVDYFKNSNQNLFH
jgi:hypothetical protein